MKMRSHGVGGTLAGKALSVTAMRATFQHVLTQHTFERSIPLSLRYTQGVEDVIEELGLPWLITRLGCRA